MVSKQTNEMEKESKFTLKIIKSFWKILINQINTKKVLKDGSSNAPTKPKGRPKKNSIPSFSEILAAANNSTGSSAESLLSSSMLKNSSLDDDDSSSSSDVDVDLSDDDENEEICYDYSDSEDEN